MKKIIRITANNRNLQFKETFLVSIIDHSYFNKTYKTSRQKAIYFLFLINFIITVQTNFAKLPDKIEEEICYFVFNSLKNLPQRHQDTKKNDRGNNMIF